MLVESSAIQEINYNEGELEVIFKKGTVYRYVDVPNEVFEQFIESESKGQFFLQKIRNNFLFERVA